MIYNNTFVRHVSTQSGAGGAGQPQGGAVRGELEDFKLKDWNFSFCICCAVLMTTASCIQSDMMGYCLQRHRHDRLYLHFTKIFISLKPSLEKEHMSSLAWPALVFDEQQQQHLLPLEGQDTQSTGRKQRNWAGMATVNNARGRLPGFMVWDPAPNPPLLAASSFLRCTVVYTWATMKHIGWEKRGRTMKQ